jgi:hypothetical protein
MRNPRASTLWIITFFTGTIFQYWRGSQIDTLVFATVTALLLLASYEVFNLPIVEDTSLITSIGILCICTMVFMLTRIHSIPSAISYLALVPLLLKNLWRSDSKRTEASTPAIRRSSRVWFTIGLLTCLTELGNYFAADATHNDKVYPTLTVLVDPFVANSVGKLLFVFLWAIVGVGLFRVSVKK